MTRTDDDCAPQPTLAWIGGAVLGIGEQKLPATVG
jgi:hypothetical protein